MKLKMIEMEPVPPSARLMEALTAAAATTQSLADAGIEVYSAHDNGRRMVLVISAPPRFVIGAVKRRFPNGDGGTTSIHAASYRGCQLEWMAHTTGDRVASNG